MIVKRALCQKQDGEFINLATFQAWEGLKNLGIPVEFFEHKQLLNGWLTQPIDKQTLVCGFISTIRETWKQLSILEPIIPDYPEELSWFRRRLIKETTLVKAKKTPGKWFIKPIQTKLFKGSVYGSNVGVMLETAMWPDETPVYISEPVELVSEWRAFIHNKVLVGCQHYSGDFTIAPNYNDIFTAIQDYSGPTAYSMDVGITPDSYTVLIEINDFWAIGSYGLPSSIYAGMLISRWEEIMKGNYATTY